MLVGLAANYGERANYSDRLKAGAEGTQLRGAG